ncbi:DUF2783 domain-containing protein [Roseomonas sp. CCTCC AB2023176]|uniref:DUF2783 domain-containing protein n=1 Tax=Roseomonas sp. CCTCC AB2023176 TaxID=3342640 RepID=UPI0035DBE53B
MRTDPNIPDPDATYAAILEANEGLSEAESLRFALRLALILANQVGDQAVLMQAIQAAKAG